MLEVVFVAAEAVVAVAAAIVALVVVALVEAQLFVVVAVVVPNSKVMVFVAVELQVFELGPIGFSQLVGLIRDNFISLVQFKTRLNTSSLKASAKFSTKNKERTFYAFSTNRLSTDKLLLKMTQIN